MKFEMSNVGASERLISIRADICDNDSIVSMPEEVYEHMKKNSIVR